MTPGSRTAATTPAAPAQPASSDTQLVVGLVKRHRLAALVAIVAVVGAVVAGVWFANRGTTTTPAAPAAALQIQPLTLTGNAVFGALSPDGKIHDNNRPTQPLNGRPVLTEPVTMASR